MFKVPILMISISMCRLEGFDSTIARLEDESETVTIDYCYDVSR